MFDIDLLLCRVEDAYPGLIELTAAETDWLSAYLATLPPLSAPLPILIGPFNAELARRLPKVLYDPVGTERRRRQHLNFVCRHNERRLASTTDRSSNTSTTPGTPTETEREANRKADTRERQQGQQLTKEEDKEYRRIIRVAKKLNLPHRLPGRNAKIADAAKIENPSLVSKALKWGRKHNLI